MFVPRSLLGPRSLFVLTFATLVAPPDLRADDTAAAARLAMKIPSDSSPSDLPPARDPAKLEEDKAEQERQQAMRTVTIMNYTARPMTYRLARTSGATWTQPYTLQSQMMHKFMADDIGAPSVIRTLNSFGKPGYTFISFRVAGGWEVFKILTNSSYAYVENTNGHGELVDPSTAQPLAKVRAGDEQKIIDLLEANHCYFDFDDILNIPNPTMQPR